MENNYQKFKAFAENGSKALELMRSKAFNPSEIKQLRTWTLTEMCALINKSAQVIRENEKKGKLKPPKVNKKNKRCYSLEDINEIRNYFKIRPSKGKKAVPAIIAFTNFKGGVAKTTSAIHSAQYFAKAGYKVLLIDCDSQASATSCFGYAPDEHIAKEETLVPFFLGEIKSLRTIIKKTYWDGLDLIPANLTLYSVELELPVVYNDSMLAGNHVQLHRILSDGIQSIQNDYDIIVIDCPPAMSILNTNALYAANGLVVPVPPELPDIASMIQFFGMIEGTLEKFPSKKYDFLRILITKHDGSATNNAISEALRHLYGMHVMRSELAITQVIKKARTEMCSIYELQTYKGSKQTLDRAIQIVDNVNKELELLIKSIWTKNETTNSANIEKLIEVT